MMLFAGLWANTETMPAYLYWIQWMSPMRYGCEALAHTQFDEAHNLVQTHENLPFVTDIPQTYMEVMGYDLGYANCLLSLLGLFIFWQIMAYFALISQVKKVSA